MTINLIINERGQINKSIRINWENNGVSNKDIYNKNINLSYNNIINNDSVNINDNNIINNDNVNINDNNMGQEGNTSKTKLKYSLANFSYSNDGEG